MNLERRARRSNNRTIYSPPPPGVFYFAYRRYRSRGYRYQSMWSIEIVFMVNGNTADRKSRGCPVRGVSRASAKWLRFLWPECHARFLHFLLDGTDFLHTRWHAFTRKDTSCREFRSPSEGSTMKAIGDPFYRRLDLRIKLKEFLDALVA